MSGSLAWHRVGVVESGDEQRDHTPGASETAPSVLDHVAARIIELPSTGPRIAIDGPDGAGKTHFADNLAELLHSRYQRHVVRVSVDHFHNVRELRYRQGRYSPRGFWEDSYDYSRFAAMYWSLSHSAAQGGTGAPATATRPMKCCIRRSKPPIVQQYSSLTASSCTHRTQPRV